VLKYEKEKQQQYLRKSQLINGDLHGRKFVPWCCWLWKKQAAWC